MSTASFQSDEILPQALARLRGHAALVRALLDELDRLAARSSEAARVSDLGGQLAEEVSRLGCRMLECAAEMTGVASKPPASKPPAGQGGHW
jgi:hypothetical protein